MLEGRAGAYSSGVRSQEQEGGRDEDEVLQS